MNTVVCTLFEGHYHYGVAALVNSLHKNGFKGICYAGYKGSLPLWANSAIEEYVIKEKVIRILNVTDLIQIHFVPICTNYHLTNYKPNFMIDVWDFPTNQLIEGMFYFDPDIVVKLKWSYFEEWIDYGVALVHEVSNNDMPPTHPKRKAWEKVIYKADKVVNNQLSSYINAGFCGVSKTTKEFLYIWKDIFQIGVNYFGLTNNQWIHNHTQDYIFFAQDQDALNIAAMCSTVPLSEMGPEAMDFVSGGYVMSHLVGTPKPWNKKIFIEFLLGKRITLTDRLFWNNVSYPIKPYNKIFVSHKKKLIKVTSFLSRFYKK